ILGPGHQVELLERKERGQVIEGNPVPYFRRAAPVDRLDPHEGEIFFTFLGRPDVSADGISGFKSEKLYLRLGYVNIVRRSQVVVIRGTQEPVPVGHDLKDSFIGDHIAEIQGAGSSFGRAYPAAALDLFLLFSLRYNFLDGFRFGTGGGFFRIP